MPKSNAKRKAEEEARAKQKAEHWIVVFNPWHPSHHHRNSRLSEHDLRDIAWWLQIIFGPRTLQEIHHQTHQNQIIAKIDYNVDIEPKLGRHDWSAFLHNPTNYQRQEHSKIFEYNFIKFGDLTEKLQWGSYLPLSHPPPHNFPVIWDYPSPVWCDQKGSAFYWTLPLKHSGTIQEVPQDNSSPKDEPGPSAPFQPYQTPSHHPLHPLTFPAHTVGPSVAQIHVKQEPPTVKDEKDVKREGSPIRVPYPVLVCDEDEKKIKKRDPSPIRVPYPTHTYDEKNVKLDTLPLGKLNQEDESSNELTYPDSDLHQTNAHPRPTPTKLELHVESVKWLAPNREMLQTQLVLIQNPLGVQFPPPGSTSLPDVSGVWDWLQLVVDGALALYFTGEFAPVHNQNWIVARVHSYVDLKGVLGRHMWHQILEHCPRTQEHEVSIVTTYLGNPENQGLKRVDAPEATENYDKFRVPYPSPLPLLDDAKIGDCIKKRQHSVEIPGEDGLGKRIKLEA